MAYKALVIKKMKERLAESFDYATQYHRTNTVMLSLPQCK